MADKVMNDAENAHGSAKDAEDDEAGEIHQLLEQLLEFNDLFAEKLVEMDNECEDESEQAGADKIITQSVYEVEKMISNELNERVQKLKVENAKHKALFREVHAHLQALALLFDNFESENGDGNDGNQSLAETADDIAQVRSMYSASTLSHISDDFANNSAFSVTPRIKPIVSESTAAATCVEQMPKIESLLPAAPPPPPPPIFSLNEDCFEYLFKFIDVDSMATMTNVCKTFNRMLTNENGTGNRHFRRLDSLAIDTSVHSIGLARNLLRLIGSQIQHLKFTCHINGRYTDGSLKHRYFELINQYCSESIVVKLEIQDADDQLPVTVGRRQLGPRPDHAQTNTSIFLNVRELNLIRGNLNDGFIDPSFYQRINLQELCPNLTTLRISSRFAINSSVQEHWPMLQSLSLDQCHSNSMSVAYIASQNRQLKCLKFCNLRDTQIAEVSRSCRFGCIDLAVSNVTSSTYFDPLISQTHLVHLSLTGVWMLSVDEVVAGVSQLTQLRVLKLGRRFTVAYNEQSIIEMVRRLTNLQQLQLHNFQRVDSTLIEIIRSGAQLKILHYHPTVHRVRPVNRVHRPFIEANYSDFDYSDILRGIADVLTAMQKPEPFVLFLNASSIGHKTLTEAQKKNLKIKWGCRHAKFQR